MTKFEFLEFAKENDVSPKLLERFSIEEIVANASVIKEYDYWVQLQLMYSPWLVECLTELDYYSVNDLFQGIDKPICKMKKQEFCKIVENYESDLVDVFVQCKAAERKVLTKLLDKLQRWQYDDASNLLRFVKVKGICEYVSRFSVKYLYRLTDDDLEFIEKTCGKCSLKVKESVMSADLDSVADLVSFAKAIEISIPVEDAVKCCSLEGLDSIVEAVTGISLEGIDEKAYGLVVKLWQSGCLAVIDQFRGKKIGEECLVLNEKFFECYDWSCGEISPRMFEEIKWSGSFGMKLNKQSLEDFLNRDNATNFLIANGICDSSVEGVLCKYRNPSQKELSSLAFNLLRRSFSEWKSILGVDDVLCLRMIMRNYYWDKDSVKFANLILDHPSVSHLSKSGVNDIFYYSFYCASYYHKFKKIAVLELISRDCFSLVKQLLFAGNNEVFLEKLKRFDEGLPWLEDLRHKLGTGNDELDNACEKYRLGFIERIRFSEENFGDSVEKCLSVLAGDKLFVGKSMFSIRECKDGSIGLVRLLGDDEPPSIGVPLVDESSTIVENRLID